MKLLDKVAALRLLISEKKPLIHHITNYVTVNDCANITLAIGAYPIMARDKAEVEEIVSRAGALVLNTGTLSPGAVEAMLLAGQRANALGVPVVLDPVGVGASRLRREAVAGLLARVRISVLKGNMSEIKFLAGLKAGVQGVDATADSRGSEKAARELARRLSCVVAITGRRDVLSDGERIYYVDNGQAMLTRVSGTGCMTTSLIASYCAVTDEYLAAALGGIMTMGIAGELAGRTLQNNEGPGTFKVRLFDAVYNLTPAQIRDLGLVTVGSQKGDCSPLYPG
ncbi:MAG TPA: hydroxyethylthiazole kinase [Firmicutes bacterium]|nr:hydroxyethylthiazole kinase [Bacillota bacterium]